MLPCRSEVTQSTVPLLRHSKSAYRPFREKQIPTPPFADGIIADGLMLRSFNLQKMCHAHEIAGNAGGGESSSHSSSKSARLNSKKASAVAIQMRFRGMFGPVWTTEAIQLFRNKSRGSLSLCQAVCFEGLSRPIALPSMCVVLGCASKEPVCVAFFR